MLENVSPIVGLLASRAESISHSFASFTRERYFRIPKSPCNVLFIMQVLMKCLDLKQLVLFIFEMMKKWSPTSVLCNMKQDMKVMKSKS